MIPQGAFLDPRPFGLPADSNEIVLDIPIAPSVNRIYHRMRGHVFKTHEYRDWMRHADRWVLLKRQYPRRPIIGQFEMELWLSNNHRGDGDNRIKACLDYLQSRQIIKNDVDCRKGRWEWVVPELAPIGCHIILRTLHEI